MAGESAPRCRDRGIGAIGKQPEQFQKKGHGLSPSVTSTYYPLNNYVRPCVGTLGLPTGVSLGLDVGDLHRRHLRLAMPRAALPARAGGRLLMWRIGGGGTIGMAGALLQANIERGDPHGLLLDDGEQLDDQAAHDEQGLSPTGGIERKTH